MRSINNSLQSFQQYSRTRPLVIICTSLIGGTGSAIALDIAYITRHLLLKLGSDAYILGVFALINMFEMNGAAREMCIARQIATLKEIQYFSENAL